MFFFDVTIQDYHAFCRYHDRLLVELHAYARNMSEVLSIFQNARELEQTSAANMGWLQRQLRSIRSPSDALLKILPELDTRDII